MKSSDERLITRLIKEVLHVEKGYVLNPRDKGGETNFGITEAVAREEGYKGKMIDMKQSEAEVILKNKYLIKPKFMLFSDISYDIVNELFDTGVNCGTRVAGKFLQEVLNSFRWYKSSTLYENLEVDGYAWGATKAALLALIKVRGKAQVVALILNCLNAKQSVHYMNLSNKDDDYASFCWGWHVARVSYL